MGVFTINQAACVSCLKCIEACPVTAIGFGTGGLTVDRERCISCGACVDSCVHGAILEPQGRQQVESFVKAKRRVILSLDPACRAFLPQGVTTEHLAAAAQQLGVWEVAEASEAAAAVASEYARLLRDRDLDNLILSYCPVVQNLVEQHFPELVEFLAPVASPMIAHGRMLKRDFTSAAVVYVTGCVAAGEEAADVRHSTEVGAVMTFSQLMDWFQEAGIQLENCEPEPLLSDGGGVGTLSGFAGGMTQAITYFYPQQPLRPVVAQGVTACMEVLEELRQGKLHHCLLDLSACPGGCVGGRGGTGKGSLVAARNLLEDLVKAEGEEPYFDTHGIALANPAISRPAPQWQPQEADIQEMLYHIGVGNPMQQQDCGACGYATCRARAEAILAHRENVSLCRRVVYEARRDVFRQVYDSLPLAALLVDEDQRVVGLNSEAGSLFALKPDQEKYIFELMDPGDFQYVLETGLAIKNRRMDIPEIMMRVEANLVPLPGLHMVLGLFQDITQEEETEAQLQRSRLQSVEMAQKVIEKQMTVAQQIAYLLGETTAETKVTLNQLKARILEEETP